MTGRDMEAKKAYDRASFQRRKAAGTLAPRVKTPESIARDKERYAVKDAWRTNHRRFVKIMRLGGVELIARADRQKPTWRDEP